MLLCVVQEVLEAEPVILHKRKRLPALPHPLPRCIGRMLRCWAPWIIPVLGQVRDTPHESHDATKNLARSETRRLDFHVLSR